MSNILTIAYAVEGSTDKRFLENIIQRTFEDIAFTCEGDINVYPILYLSSPKTGNAVENIMHLAREAFHKGIQVLCIHVDADAANEDAALRDRINPGFTTVQNMEIGVCKNLVSIIPVHMSESWMLADKELFKSEVGTTKSNQDLGIARRPETIADPKQVIEEALRIAQEDMPKKRRQMKINILYQPLGQKISLNSLEDLKSYLHFQEAVRGAFIKLNYLH